MKEKSILWVFLAFVLGFSLPVCSCAGGGLLLTSALAGLAGGGSGPSIIEENTVAVIHLDGVISSTPPEYFSTTGITPARVRDLLDRADVPNIKAVVVQVNSPGGSVVASDEIYHMLLDFDKPVVVWMGDVAASGGYYISCGGDYVIAHPDSLTGSIGVISQFINAEGLMEKVGVEALVITSGPHKDIGSPFREMTAEEQALWQTIIDEVYGDFVAVVARSRDLPEETVRELADGRVYTGRQALENGLVDAVGTPDDAVAKAAELGGIVGEPHVIELRSTPTLMEILEGARARPTLPSLDEVLSWAGAPSLQFRFTR